MSWLKPLVAIVSFGLIFSIFAEDAKKEEIVCKNSEEFSETSHQVTINGKPIDYKAVAGNLILKNEKCEPKASIFFISYTKQGENQLGGRPITFCFNGGPGSASVWLHLGMLGPQRVFMDGNGDALPPYRLVDNQFSLLDTTDLVFIDPVSTGYSTAIPPEDAKNYYGVDEDVKSIAEFIRLYLTRYQRWESPKFIIGESYGTTRAAALTGYLHDHCFIYMNGLVLISSVLNFQSIDFSVGNDLAPLLFLPSYTATAWYHKKLSPELQLDFQKALQQARDFVINEYSLALFKGDLLKPEEKKQIVNQLVKFTGLSPQYIERSNLRIEEPRFSKELLRDQNRIVGRMDGRFKGIDGIGVGEKTEYDPSIEAILGAFTSTFNHYVSADLKWAKDAHYKTLANVQPWNYGSDNQYLNVGETLRQVMTKNRYLRVFVGNGYYDLATPFFATEYTFNHLGLEQKLLQHVTMKNYEGGHMMYVYHPTLVKMKEDLSAFYKQTLSVQDQEEKETR